MQLLSNQSASVMIHEGGDGVENDKERNKMNKLVIFCCF